MLSVKKKRLARFLVRMPQLELTHFSHSIYAPMKLSEYFFSRNKEVFINIRSFISLEMDRLDRLVLRKHLRKHSKSLSLFQQQYCFPVQKCEIWYREVCFVS